MSPALVAFQKQLSLSLPGSHHPEVAQARQTAMQQALAQGWPTHKNEAWKYTSTRLFQEHVFSSSTKLTHEIINQDEKHDVLYFIDGFFSEEQSQVPKNIQIIPLFVGIATDQIEHNFYQAQPQDSTFSLLNHALWQSGLLIHIPKQTKLDKPLKIIFLNTMPHEAQHIKIAIHLDEGTHAEIILDSQSLTTENNFLNLMLSTHLADHANLTMSSLHEQHSQGLYYIHHQLHQKTHSHFLHISKSLKTQWLRHELYAHLAQPYATCQLLGTYEGRKDALIDHHLNVLHEAAHCESHQYYKGVLHDQSKAIFNGRVYVAKDAQKTISRQKNDTILLSPRTEIDTKPELEIYADDVVCAHGVTVGTLDDTALFYLMSRGLDENFAKELLLSAFMNQVFSEKKLCSM